MFDVNSDYFIELSTIEECGYNVQIRELEKISNYEGKCTIYIWAPDGRTFRDVPEQFYNDPICWESTLFSNEGTQIIFETHNAYLMHDGECCCLTGMVGQP